MIGAHAALLKNYGAKAEAMNDLVAEIEGVFDEDPKDGVAAASAFSVSSQARQQSEKDTWEWPRHRTKELSLEYLLDAALNAKSWKLV